MADNDRWTSQPEIDLDALSYEERQRVEEHRAAWAEWQRTGDEQVLIDAGVFSADD